MQIAVWTSHEAALAKAVHLPIASQNDGTAELAGASSRPWDWTVPPVVLPAGILLPGVPSLGRVLMGSAPGMAAGAAAPQPPAPQPSQPPQQLSQQQQFLLNRARRRSIRLGLQQQSQQLLQHVLQVLQQVLQVLQQLVQHGVQQLVQHGVQQLVVQVLQQLVQESQQLLQQRRARSRCIRLGLQQQSQQLLQQPSQPPPQQPAPGALATAAGAA